LDEFIVERDRQQVGIRKVAIVVRFFLRAQRARLALVWVVEARFLPNRPAAFEHVDLPRDFIIDRSLDEPERVEILDLATGTELLLARRPHRHVRIAAERAFLHVAVADLEIAHERVDLLHVRHRLFGGTHVGLGYDFEQRRTRAVQIDAGKALEILVQRFACIFFQMRARNADRLARAVLEHDLEPPLLDDGLLVLADLIALRQIRIKIVLACEYRTPRNGCVDCETEFHRHSDSLSIQNRQYPRVAEIDEVRLRIRRRAVSRGRAREDLALRRELRVDLKTDDCFPRRHRLGLWALLWLCGSGGDCRLQPAGVRYSYPRGVRLCQSVSR